MSDKGIQVDWDDDGFLDVDACYAKVRELRAELAQAREKAQYDLTHAKRVANTWFNKAKERTRKLEKAHEYNAGLATEVKRQDVELAQAHEELALVRADLADKVQGLWLSPVEAEELRQQLAAQVEDEATIVEAAKTLISKLKIRRLHVRACGRKLFCESELTALQRILEQRHGETTTKPLERLATLDAAETELADARRVAGLWFGTAQKQAWRLATLDAAEAALADARRVAAAWFRRAQEAELAAHVHDKACCELVQTMRTERQEVERELDEASGNLKCMVELNEWSRNELDRVGKRAERTKALAALVTPELTALLEKVGNLVGDSKGWTSIGHFTSQDGTRCRALAVRLREAMEADDEPR